MLGIDRKKKKETKIVLKYQTKAKPKGYLTGDDNYGLMDGKSTSTFHG